MNDQRKDVLEMLAEGKVTADEAEQLIAALERDKPVGGDLAARPKGRPKYMRVMVDTVEGGEPGRVNVRVPLQLLRAGVRLATLIPPPAMDKINGELAKSGVLIDLTQLKPEQLEELVEHLEETTVEVDQPDAKVRVFCE
jgi:hypothetical protein